LFGVFRAATRLLTRLAGLGRFHSKVSPKTFGKPLAMAPLDGL
jgi:hypothetical protein